MIDICFVVLHYLAIDSTMTTVDSIFDKCDTSSYMVVIVDNSSPDDSGKVLLKKYKSDNRVIVLINKKNSGFSAGNNVGYRYAKQELKSKYIVLMNNDVIIKSSNLVHAVMDDFKQYGYAVLGPRIYDVDDRLGTQNPVNEYGYTKKELIFKKYDYTIWLFLCSFYLEEIWLKGRKAFIHWLRLLLGKKKSGQKNEDYFAHKQFDVMLHGCFWILSPKYVSTFEGIEELTFMYHEELILWLQVKRNHMIMMYDPEIEIFHAHMASTNSVHRSKRKSKKIKYKRELDSVKSVLHFLKNELK